MNTTRCECCDLPVESCGKAAEQLQRRIRQQEIENLQRRGWFPSAYGGSCFSCSSHFTKGTMIKAVLGGYKAECCS